jgi:hypothetical protein
MTALRRRLLHRHFAWLLWLALLLPLGQAAGAWHALSHARTDVAGDSDTKALHVAHCDLCMVAAAVTGGAPAGQPPALPAVAARHEAPQAGASTSVPAAPPTAYLSRAPPLASR